MKTIFVSAGIKKEPDYEKVVADINQLPYKKIALCYSNQFIHIANKIETMIDKEILNKLQVLGCSNPRFKEEVEAILIVGQGDFHPVSLAYESGLPTYVLEDETLREITRAEVERLEKREKGAKLKYLNSERVGVLITNKPGQKRLNKALEFKKNLKNKKAYLFIANDIDINQFENFVGIEYWVNTACPRMDLNEAPIVNLEKLNF